jgi:hypothetical protein
MYNKVLVIKKHRGETISAAGHTNSISVIFDPQEFD